MQVLGAPPSFDLKQRERYMEAYQEVQRNKASTQGGKSDRGQSAFLFRFRIYLKRVPDSEMADLYRASRDGKPYGGYTGAQLRSVLSMVKEEYIRRQKAYEQSLREPTKPASPWSMPASWTGPTVAPTPQQSSPAVASPVPYQAPAPIPTSPTLPAPSAPSAPVQPGPPSSSSAGGSGGGGSGKGAAGGGGADVAVATSEAQVEAAAAEAGMVSQEPVEQSVVATPPAPKKSKAAVGVAVVVVAAAAFGIWKWKFAKK